MNFCLLTAFTAFGERFRCIILLSVCQIGENRRREEGHIAHETAVCRNSAIPDFSVRRGA